MIQLSMVRSARAVPSRGRQWPVALVVLSVLALAAAGCGGDGGDGGDGDGGDGDGGATPAGPASARPEIDAELLATASALVPGTTAELGVVLRIPRPWHLYGPTRNDTGMPPQLTWQLPEGFGIGTERWPVPHRYVSPGDILDHVYHDELVLLAPLAVPPDVAAGDSVTLRVRIRWLACAEVCVPGASEAALTLPVATPGSEPPAAGAAVDSLFARTRERWATPPTAGAVRHSWAGDVLVLEVPGADRLVFYPADEGREITRPLADAEAEGAVLRLQTGPAPGTANAADALDDSVRGVLAVHGAGDVPVRFWSIDIPGPEGPRHRQQEEASR
ncbi:MAG: protein-disulfide reductase DsbD family protein [Candidatus Krumholzibacteriia bacterium]